MKVGPFVPCYVDAFFPEVGIATLELLEGLGCSLRYPLEQTRCGQPMASRGCQDDAAVDPPLTAPTTLCRSGKSVIPASVPLKGLKGRSPTGSLSGCRHSAPPPRHSACVSPWPRGTGRPLARQ